jgi:hypothetical protein
MSVLTGVGYVLLGAALTAFFIKAFEFWQRRRGRFTGVWTASIEAIGTEPSKRDLWRLHQVGQAVRGRIEREAPPGRGGPWSFVGRDVNGDLLGFFWCLDATNRSCGAVLLHQQEAGIFQGHYLRHRDRGIRAVPIQLRRRGRCQPAS